MDRYHCPHCYTRYEPGKGTTPAKGDFLVCPRCGSLLVFRWRQAAEGLRLEHLVRGEFQALPVAVQEQLARIGQAAVMAAQRWEAPRWN